VQAAAGDEEDHTEKRLRKQLKQVSRSAAEEQCQRDEGGYND